MISIKCPKCKTEFMPENEFKHKGIEFIGCLDLTVKIMDDINNCMGDMKFNGVSDRIEQRIKTAYMNGFSECLRKG